MKKVFLCIPTLATAGAEKFVVDLASNINNKAFDVSVIVTYKLNSTDLYKKLLSEKIKVINLGYEKNRLKTIIELTKLFLKERPDVVHANVGSLQYVALPAFLSGVKKKLFTVHSMAYRIAGGRMKRIYNFAFHYFGFKPVGISQIVTESIIQEYGMQSDLVATVNNGIDIQKFAPEASKMDGDITFINVGTLYYIKNQKYLIECFYEVHKANPKTKLIIVGDGELREELDGLIRKLNLENAVSLVGNQNDVAPYLKCSDIYVSSSLVEGLPLSVLEGMACGLPVISNKVGGIPDIVNEGKNGLLIELDDRKAFIEAMLSLSNDEAKRKAFGKESRDIVCSYWSLEQCVKGYEKLYF